MGQFNIDRSLPKIELYPISINDSGWGVEQVGDMLSLANIYLRTQQCDLQLYAEDVVEIRAPDGYQVLEESEQIELEKNFGFMPMMILADDLQRKSNVAANERETSLVEQEEEQNSSEQNFDFSKDTNGLGIIGMGYIYLSNNLLVDDQKTACLPLLLIHEIMHAMLGYESEQHSNEYYNIFFSNCFSNVHTLKNTKLDKQDCNNLQHYAKSLASGQRRICKKK